MSDNRQGNYQPLLTTGLAIALGATLMTVVGSNDATAYPSGAVSYGANPVFSVGGTLSYGDVLTPLTAPTGSDLIITDVYISASAYQYGSVTECMMNISFSDSTGNVIASFRAGGAGRYENALIYPVLVSYDSGLRVAAGDSLIMTAVTPNSVHDCLEGSQYTLSGYYAEP